jgi:hypothetical protein
MRWALHPGIQGDIELGVLIERRDIGEQLYRATMAKRNGHPTTKDAYSAHDGTLPSHKT